jgi:hypothetical protein
LNPFSEVFCYQIDFQIRLQICLRPGGIVPDGACGKPPRRSEDGSDFRNFSDFRFQFKIGFGFGDDYGSRKKSSPGKTKGLIKTKKLSNNPHSKRRKNKPYGPF